MPWFMSRGPMLLHVLVLTHMQTEVVGKEEWHLQCVAKSTARYCEGDVGGTLKVFLN